MKSPLGNGPEQVAGGAVREADEFGNHPHSSLKMPGNTRVRVRPCRPPGEGGGKAPAGRACGVCRAGGWGLAASAVPEPRHGAASGGSQPRAEARAG